MANRGRLMTHGALLTQVWGPGYADDVATLRTHIANLRRKVEPEGARAPHPHRGGHRLPLPRLSFTTILMAAGGTLISPAYRRAMLVACQQAPPSTILRARLAERPELQTLIAELRTDEACHPRGVALTRLLLTDADSPLYEPASEEELSEALTTAYRALRFGEPD